MARRKDFVKANTYTHQSIKGEFSIYYKIDGVRLLWRDGRIVTRNDKHPPGLASLTLDAVNKIQELGDVELYTGDFAEVSGTLNRKSPQVGVFDASHVYGLVDCDERLVIGHYHSDEFHNQADIADFIDSEMACAVALGYEGLIIRKPKGDSEMWYRHKPKHTADVRITGYFEQEDKHGKPKNCLGGFITNYGNVTAMSDELRKSLWVDPESSVGRLIEVEYRELYDTGNFRFGVTFLRFRDDKDEESFDTKS